MAYYFRVPFGTSGDRAAIPITDVAAGPISFTYGYGGDYSLPRETDPAALTIERTKFNQLMFAVTENIQQYQQYGTPWFITTADNGGTPFPYETNAEVLYDNAGDIGRYVSLVDANIALPTNTANWHRIYNDPAFLSISQTFTAIQQIAAGGVPLIINSTDSNAAKISLRDNGVVRGGIGATAAYSAAIYLANLTTLAAGWTNAGMLLPGTTNIYDLGAVATVWRAVYATTFIGAVTGNASTATALANGRTISISGDLVYASPSFDGSTNVTAAGTLATVNSNVGSFGSATQVATFTVNGKGLTTAASNVTITPAVGSITGLGTNVATALAVNVGLAGAFVTFNGALGTPSSGTVTNLTGTAGINITGTAPAGTLTGATLAATVLASSLTSVGILTGGSTGAGFTVALNTATIIGDLAFSNLTQGSARSVLAVAGNATADFASVQGAANQILAINGAGTALGWQSTMDAVVIGGTTRAAGSFTTISANTSLTINANAAALPSPISGTLFQIGNVDGTSTRFEIDSFGAATQCTMVRYNNTAASPSAVLAGEVISSLNSFGYGASALSTTPCGNIRVSANTNFTNASNEAYMSFLVAPSGGLVASEVFRINSILSAANYLQFINNVSGSAPTINYVGTDTNINATIVAKGTGVLVCVGSYTNSVAGSGNVQVSAAGLFQRFTSMEKYKDEIEPIETDRAIDIIDALQPIWYKSLCKSDIEKYPDRSYYGFGAETISKIDPRLAQMGLEPLDTFDESGYPKVGDKEVPIGVAYERLVAVMVAAYNEKFSRMSERIISLESKMKG